MLAEEGFDVHVAASGAEAWARFQETRPDVVLLDLVLGDADGLDVLRKMKQEAPDTKVILISAHGSIESAVTAMKLGGYDFIKKPFELEEIVAAVRNAVRTSRLEQRVAYLAAQERRRSGGAAFVHAAPEMTRLLGEVEVIAKSPVPLVLVTGESGTGKQAIARMLHEGSPRASGPFVELNCSAIPENLVESELFGHERGAFSDARERKLGLVEIADGGTLFLDEIGDLGAGAQAKLLTFLEQRTFRRVGATAVRRVDARVVAATNRDLPAAVAAHTFREDLFYRLNAITVHLPPLRERTADVRALAEHFLAESAREFGRRFQEIAPETAGLLRTLPLARQRARAARRDRARRAPPRRHRAAPGAPARRAAGRGAGGPGGRPGRRRVGRRRSRRSRRWSSATSAACWRSAAATARWPPSTSASPARRWPKRWRRGGRQQRRVTRSYCGSVPLLPVVAAWPGAWLGATRNSPQSDASRTMSALVWTRSLPLMWPRWVSTVLMLMPSRPAICLLELPQITRSKICRSRCDSRSMAWVPAFFSARAPAPTRRGGGGATPAGSTSSPRPTLRIAAMISAGDCPLSA